MFYAFCGTNYEDAVAIDNISSQTTTPEPTTPEPTTPEPTTPEQTTPEQTTPEPTTPEQTTQEQTTPEQTTPEQTTPRPRYCQDYSPCFCSLNFNEIYVECEDVSVQTVRDVFQRVNDPEIFSLIWTQPLPDDETNTPEDSLPEDFLGNTSVTGKIYIQSYSINRLNLFIDPLAFRASQKSLSSEFKVSNFDFGLQKDLNFLNGFDKLEELTFSTINNLTAFQYLPPLPLLQYLTIRGCSDVNEIAFPDLSPAKLKNLDLYDNEINDDKADEILAKLTALTSADSLGALDLYRNYLTRIPSQVESAFPNLQAVDLGNNNISYIPSSSLTFASPYLNTLDLDSNELKTIESGAFVGINRLLSEQERIIIRVLLFL